MNAFQDIGDEINRIWRRSGYDEKDLPLIACEVISSSGILRDTDIQEVIYAAATGGKLDGFQIVSEFSDLPYIVYKHSRFFIEVLFWTNGTTTIHNHSFSGAFGIVSGDSICVTYDFNFVRRINSRFHIGDLRVKEFHHLRQYDVKPIYEGNALIHAVYHIARPTVTLVIRTAFNPDANPQLTFKFPRIALEQDYIDPVTIKQFQAINVMLQTDFDRYSDDILEILKHAATDSQYWIVRGIDFSVLPDWFEGKVKEIFRGRDYGQSIIGALEHERATRHVTSLRSKVSDRSCSLFLAGVLNIPHRDSLVQLLCEEVDQTECREIVCRHIGEMMQSKLIHWTDSTKGLPELVCQYLFDNSDKDREELIQCDDLLIRCLASAID